MFTECNTDFNIYRALSTLMAESPFYAEISRNLRKVPTNDIETAGVTYDPKRDEMCLFFNPLFMSSLPDEQQRGVLIHEMDHLVFGHVNGRRKTPHTFWNIATDLAINSLIMKYRAGCYKEAAHLDPLPKWTLLPGRRPIPAPPLPGQTERKLTKEDEEVNKWLGDLIEKFPTERASEWYFNEIMKSAAENNMIKKIGIAIPGGNGEPSEGGSGTIGSWDNHDVWDQATGADATEEYVEARVKEILEKAVKRADSTSDGWGNMPSEIREAIRKSVSTIINWRAVLRQFIGTLVRGAKTSSIKRINRRYPYVHPGTKRSYNAKLIVALDDSGSVGQDMTELFFAELASLTKKVSISVIHFDTSCGKPYEWRRGSDCPRIRQRSGGTDFNAPTNFVNLPENRGKWDGMLICTDGECSEPSASRIKRGWVLAPNHKLLFNSNELQIFPDKAQQMTGAWR